MFRNPSTPLWPPKKTYFFENFEISAFFEVSQKVGFLGARGGCLSSEPSIRSSNIWGDMVLSFFGPKKVNFKENIGGAFNAPS